MTVQHISIMNSPTSFITKQEKFSDTTAALCVQEENFRVTVVDQKGKEVNSKYSNFTVLFTVQVLLQ